MLKAHRRFPRVKEKLPRQPDKQHGRATTKGYSYYSIARNEKKGAYTMSTNEMTSKIRELKELKAMAEDLAAEITAIEDTIKAEMTARNTDTARFYRGGVQRVTLILYRPLQRIVAGERGGLK